MEDPPVLPGSSLRPGAALPPAQCVTAQCQRLFDSRAGRHGKRTAQFRRILYDGFIPHPEQLFELLAICLATWLFALALFRRFAPRLPKEV